jgi:hypothetical protein
MYIPCKFCGTLDLGARADDDVDLANFIYENTTRATLDLDLIACWMNDRGPLLMLDWQSRSFLA